MNVYNIVFLLSVFLCGCVFTPPIYNSTRKNRNNQVSCWNDIDFKRTEEALLTSPVLRKISIEEYLKIKLYPKNPTVFLLFLKNGLKAVFKPNRPDNSIYSAVMSYRFSQFMGWNLVPPTVIRTINGEKGSVQLFIEGNRFEPVESMKLTLFQRSDIFTHYFVLGDPDAAAEKNIILGNMCGEPALIDNDKMLTKHVYFEYGDYQFVNFTIKNIKISLSSYKEYENFPAKRIRFVNIKKLTFSQFKKLFLGLNSGDLRWLYRRRSRYNAGNLYFVKWKNSYWVKLNFPFYDLIYKDFIPVVFSRRTISKLKLLNSDILNSLSPDFPVPKEFISGILYRRNVILKEARKLRFKNKHECIL